MSKDKKIKIYAPEKGYGDTSFKDMEAVHWLSRVITNHKTGVPDLKTNDTGPNYDGFIKLVDSSHREIGLITTQVKYRKIDNSKETISYSFTDGGSFISFCKVRPTQVCILIIVDPSSEVAYWREMSPEYIEGLNGKKTVTFEDWSVIRLDYSGYHDIWKRICDNRTKGIEGKNQRERENAGHVPSLLPPKPISLKAVSDAGEQLQALFIDDELRYKYLLPFISMLEPLSLDVRSNDNRERLRKLFKISEKQEIQFIDRMTSEGLIKKVGDIYITVEREKSDKLLNEIIDKGAIPLETLTKLFS